VVYRPSLPPMGDSPSCGACRTWRWRSICLHPLSWQTLALGAAPSSLRWVSQSHGSTWPYWLWITTFFYATGFLGCWFWITLLAVRVANLWRYERCSNDARKIERYEYERLEPIILDCYWSILGKTIKVPGIHISLILSGYRISYA
jgi:hypothetical protein